MADGTATAGVYTDFSGLAKLRAGARANSPAATAQAARQFESLFTQMLLKSMRATSFGDDGLGSQGGLYRDLFDQQLALAVSAGKGLGIADLMLAQLRRSQAASATAAAEPFRSDRQKDMDGLSPPAKVPLKPADHLGMTLPVAAPRAANPADAPGAVVPASRATEIAAARAGEEAPQAASWPPRGPLEFLCAIWPHAVRAAKAIGVSARTLVAQAALETGWGRHVAHGADGKSSFNLFGIKAHGGWSGETVEAGTQEIVDGVPQARRGRFRGYDSLAQAFDDYVSFVQGNPRYAVALRHDGEGAAYAAGLQQAGYATDPQYAEKIRRIAESPRLQQALARLRLTGELSV